LQRYVSIVAIGSLMLLLFAGTMRDAASQAAVHPLRSVGAGVITVGACLCGGIAIAFLAVVLMAAMLGGDLGFVLTALAGGIVAAGLAIILLTVGILLLFAAYAVVGLLTGQLLLSAGGRDGRLEPPADPEKRGTRSKLARAADQPFIALFVGAIIVAIFAALPGFAGYVVDIVVLLLGLGAGALAIRHRDELVATRVSIIESAARLPISEPSARLVPAGAAEATEAIGEER
jgi:hypothetical protein